MQVNNISASQRIRLDAQELAAAPRVAQPAEPAPEARPVARPTAPAGPTSAFARQLDDAFRSLRTQFDESTLGAGMTFRAPALEARSNVLRIQPVEAGPRVERQAPASLSQPEGRAEVGAQPPPSEQASGEAAMPPSVNRAAPSPEAEVAERSTPADRDLPAEPSEEGLPARASDPARQLGDATLGTLAGAAGLQAAAGRFQLDVNGQVQTFRADQPLSDLVSRLSGPSSGTQATLDPRGQLVVRSTTDEELSITDRRGNLASGLGIAVTPSENTNAALARDLQDFATGIGRAINLVETQIGQAPEMELQSVLRELEGALSSLFTPSGDGSLQSLGDLGFSRANGEVVVDQTRLQQLVASRTDEVNRVVDSVRDNAQPVLQSGERVAQTVDASLSDARRATQETRVRLEVARLQVRQQTLTLDRVAAEGLRQRVAEQSQALGRIAEALAAQVPSGLAEPSEQAIDFARGLPETRPRPRPASSYRLPVPNFLRSSLVDSGT
jgi:hypothetical protein